MSILPMTTWGLDPLLHVPLQLMIFQVKALKPVPDYEGVYSHHTHPVSMVEIMGVIQSVNRAIKYLSYTVDDGTGAIQCVMWIPDNYLMVQDTDTIVGLRAFSLGDVVRVRGHVEVFRDVMQIDVPPGCIEVCEDPNAETLFRLRVLNQERDVYTKPLKLPNFILREVGIDIPLDEEEMAKEEVTKEVTNKEANKEEIAKEEVAKENVANEEDTKEEATKARVAKVDVPKEEVTQDEVTKMALLGRIRAWVLERKEFCILELLDDEVNKQMAEEVAKDEDDRPLMRCFQRLLTEGSIEYINEETMDFRAVDPLRKKTKEQGPSGGERIAMDGGEPIVIDDD
ncbi:CST complex subunit STN1 [Linnemannia schmuckeri]|uniref:CST complex subunit STN1 n=1 Tax=Linnemannia schmuckeri TaxID=64567 RepID=A0A9P5RY33_9FUNG|nr:CST complex subunit STN1 [Linnemannia schmuckeri]